MALLVQSISAVSPVQFSVGVFVFCRHLYVHTLDVHWCDLWCLPLEVDHRLLCFTAVYMQAAAFTPVNKVTVYEETAVFLLFSAIGGSLQNETMFRVIENVVWNNGRGAVHQVLSAVHYY